MNNYNPILSQINQTSGNNLMNRLMPQIRQAKSLLQQFKSGPNAQLAMNQFLMGNPQLKSVMDFVQTQHNGNAKEAFYDYANQMGINPDEFISQLNNN